MNTQPTNINKSALIAGVDEAGRGPLAGPVIAAAVILPARYHLPGLKDSKKMTENQRASLFEAIQQQAVSFAIGRAEPQEIDKINILEATMLAMTRAIMGLSTQPELARIDGNRAPHLDCKVETIIKGDALIPAISAASILAKVTRDREMLQWHEKYPEYGFAIHKGYPTAAHRQAIIAHGVTDIHRLSYRPVREALQRQLGKEG